MLRFLIPALVLLLAAPPAHADKSDAGGLSGRVRTQKKVDAVVVYLEPVGFTALKHLTRKPPRRPAPQIRQRHKRFRPNFVVVNTGGVVSFPNNDTRSHNVYAKIADHILNRFDLGTYRMGTTRSKRFRKPGKVKVECNIHPDMAATVLVLEHDFSLTDKNGRWKIDGVPSGWYRLVAYTPSLPKFRRYIRVEEGRVTRVEPIKL